MMMITLATAGMPMGNIYAQSVSQKMGNALGNAQSEAVSLSHKVGNFLGLDDRTVNNDDLYRVKGQYYAPIYDVNLFGGKDSAQMRGTCRQLFEARYPQAEIMSVALPQVDWVEEPIVKNKQVVGYMQTMYCYILARDVQSGYINAKFSFKRYRDVGGEFELLPEYYPMWERTDYLTEKVFQKLVKM